MDDVVVHAEGHFDTVERAFLEHVRLIDSKLVFGLPLQVQLYIACGPLRTHKLNLYHFNDRH